MSRFSKEKLQVPPTPPAVQEPEQPEAQQPTFLSLGGNRAARIAAIESFSAQNGGTELVLTGNHVFTSTMPWCELAGILFPTEDDQIIIGRTTPAKANVSLSYIPPASPSPARFITLTAMYSGQENTIRLEDVVAYQPRNGQLVLHMSSGRTQALPLEHLPQVAAAIASVYGEPAQMTRPQSATEDVYVYDPRQNPVLPYGHPLSRRNF